MSVQFFFSYHDGNAELKRTWCQPRGQQLKFKDRDKWSEEQKCPVTESTKEDGFAKSKSGLGRRLGSQEIS